VRGHWCIVHRGAECEVAYCTSSKWSGHAPDIREAILGHSDTIRSVKQRYLTIKDHMLLQEIDKMTFDHGDTEIWLSEQR
jgi:hypothetical protein